MARLNRTGRSVASPFYGGFALCLIQRNYVFPLRSAVGGFALFFIGRIKSEASFPRIRIEGDRSVRSHEMEYEHFRKVFDLISSLASSNPIVLSRVSWRKREKGAKADSKTRLNSYSS